MTTSMEAVEQRPLDADAGPEEILRQLGVRDARQLYGALVLRPGSRADLEQRVQALALPNDRVPDLRAGDLLVRVALGERHGLLSVLVTGDLVDRRTAERRGWQVEGTLRGRFAHVVEGPPRPHDRAELWARRVADHAGHLPAGHAVLRLTVPPRHGREASEAETGALVETIGLGHTCRAGEGPPAPEPDPTGRGPHPLISRGVGPARSRRPSVGHAQQCLNAFLARQRAGTHTCAATSAEARAYVAAAIRTLGARGQIPLEVDCRFGPATETATRAFQACAGIGRDGQIGPITWPLLDAFSPSSPVPTPVPVPPIPVPPLAPAATLGALEGRYFPPPGGTDAAPFSRAGTIEPIVDGRDYFAAIRAQISALRAGDVWYVAGWWVDPDFTFATGGPTLGDLLVDRAAAGVDVRVILWTSSTILDFPGLVTALVGPFYAGLARRNILSAERLRARTDAAGRRPLAGRVLADWSPGHAASSHHMKLSVFGRSGALTAFAGGIDYVNDRLTSPTHRGASPLGQANGWHDAGARLTGHGAERILETFVTRWAEASTLSANTYDIGSGSRQFNPPPIHALTPPVAGPASPSSDTSVSIVRSFPNAKEFGLIRNRPWATLPAGGVHEVLRTFQTAIAAARRYIYIEDQSFDAVATLFPPLVAACARGVRVIALLPGVGDPNEAPAATPRTLSNAVRTGIVNRLTPAQQTNLAVWQLAGIFVHTKLILIDDEFLSVGSANFMDRSMQDTPQSDDSELTATAVSTGNLVADLRVRLWAEHLRVTGAPAEAELRDLSRSLGFWRPAWGTGLTFTHPDTQLVFVGP